MHQRRYDIAVVVSDAKPAGEIGRFEFAAMQVPEIEVRGGIDLEMRAIDWFWWTRLPSGGYLPRDLPFYESWFGLPFAHGFEYFELAVQWPVVRA